MNKNIFLMFFEAIFIACIIGLALFFEAPTMDFITAVMFFLAVLRMARTISFNEVAEPLRKPFTKVEPDSCGAGENVHPRGSGLRYVIGSMLSCPICSGTWSALVLYALWVIVPTVGKPLVYILAFAGGSEVLHWLSCKFEWEGRAARVLSGQLSPDKPWDGIK